MFALFQPLTCVTVCHLTTSICSNNKINKNSNNINNNNNHHKLSCTKYQWLKSLQVSPDLKLSKNYDKKVVQAYLYRKWQNILLSSKEGKNFKLNSDEQDKSRQFT